ncbi:MAG: O-antigen ligase family protein [Acutalibacteraceae bacterium]
MKLKLKFYKMSGFDVVCFAYLAVYIMLFFSGSTFLSRYLIVLMMLEIVLLAAMVFIKQVKTNAVFDPRTAGLNLFLIGFMAFLICQYHVAFIPAYNIIYLRRFAVFFVFMLFIPRCELVYSQIKLTKIYSFFVGVSIYIATLLKGYKSGGLVGNYQFAGMMMSIACILFAFELFASRKDILLNIIGLIVCLGALMISGKRMFAILAVAGFLVAFLLNSNRKNFARMMVILLVVGIAVAVLYHAVDPVRNLFDRFIEALNTEDMSEATSGRSNMWRIAMDIYHENPDYGIGFGAFAKYTEQNYAAYYSAHNMDFFLTHNIYYGLLCETGNIGTAMMIGWFLSALGYTAYWWAKCRKCENTMFKYILGYSLLIQLWFIAYGWSGNGIYDFHEMFFYVTAISAALSARRGYKLYLQSAANDAKGAEETCQKEEIADARVCS